MVLVPGAAQRVFVVRCRPGTVTIWNGPGSAVHRCALRRARDTRSSSYDLPRIIPPDVSHVQIEAADPDVSAFVSANAGSGKTYVLAQRVINLLLRGVDPAKILCITFTKAAAANMANRVFDTLAHGSRSTTPRSTPRSSSRPARKPTPPNCARARRLFASALETPGGLKVQTIHAFCTRLLHQFPFEANVAARFTVLDEASTTQLLDQLTLGVLLEASAAPDSALGIALASAIVVAADQTFKEVINDAINDRDAINGWIKRAGSVDAAIAGLSKTFNLDPADTPESIEHEFFSLSLIPAAEWPDLIEILSAGSANDQKHIAALGGRALGQRARTHRQLISKCFAPRHWNRAKTLSPRNLATAHPDWLSRLVAEQDRVCALLARERAIRCPRAHPRAGHHRRRSHRALRIGKRAPRAARL